MSDDYLWDGTGEPSHEVRRLEKLLGRFRYDPKGAGHWTEGPRKRKGSRRFGIAVLAAAAGIAAVAVGLWLWSRQGRDGWEVVRLEGAPRVGASRIGATGTLSLGEWIETDASSRATIRVGSIGEATVEPNTRTRLVRTDLTDHRLALARGTLQVRIWAPPRLFFVDTPSATAVDLGCAYTLTVDDAGESLLRVASGWVAFDAGGRESFIPAGASCSTRKGAGPGTPFFEDASPALREALRRIDFDGEDPEEALAILLHEARVRDALTLWHLLTRLDGEERARVYDRMAELVPPPEGVTREGILQGDRGMIDRWWDELGLGVTTWWRLWKGPGPPSLH